MDRPNFGHDTPEICMNKLFNMVQKCRVDLEIMRNRSEFNGITDSELVKCAEALAKEARETLTMK